MPKCTMPNQIKKYCTNALPDHCTSYSHNGEYHKCYLCYNSAHTHLISYYSVIWLKAAHTTIDICSACSLVTCTSCLTAYQLILTIPDVIWVVGDFKTLSPHRLLEDLEELANYFWSPFNQKQFWSCDLRFFFFFKAYIYVS